MTKNFQQTAYNTTAQLPEPLTIPTPLLYAAGTLSTLLLLLAILKQATSFVEACKK